MTDVAPDARTLSVRLDSGAGKRLDKASSLMHQSRAAFLEKAGDEAARRVLTEWAARRYRQHGGTFSELAEETGLTVEEIMEHLGPLGGQERAAALDMFLASCRTAARTHKNRRFLRLAEQAVASLGDGGNSSASVAKPHSVKEPRAPYVTSPRAPSVQWRLDADRLHLLRASDEQRAQIDQLVDEFSRAKRGDRGGSAALALLLAGELDAGFLSRASVTRLSTWCHSTGPGHRGKPQQTACALSEALFGRVLPPLTRSAAGEAEWRALGSAAPSGPRWLS